MKSAASVGRCGSCGGPSPDGNLCPACQHAYAPLLGSTTPPLSPSPPVYRSTQAPLTTAGKTETDKEASARAVAASVVASMASRAAAAKSAGSRSESAKGVNPPVASKGPIVQPSVHRRPGSLVLAAVIVVAALAAVMVAAIIVTEGPSSLGIHRPAQSTLGRQAAPPTPVARRMPAAAPPATRSAANTAAVPVAAPPVPAVPVLTAPVATPAARPKPSAAVRPVKAVRQPSPATRPAVAPIPATKEPAPVPAPRPAPVAAAPPRALASAAIGPFFETADVDQSPKIATRVQPLVPADLPSGAKSDVVVVRLLVSQTGHPSRISLLRGSTQGRRMNDAVVAAVTQWTFSPARKRGGAVSCWYNVGVPVGRAN